MKNIADLQVLNQAQYAQAQSALRVLVVKENSLRAEIARLNQKEVEARQDTDTTKPMRAVGADVLWLGWVGRSKEHLNMALAQILAQKEHHLARVRQAYGKTIVTDTIAQKASENRRKQQRDAALEAAQNFAVLHKKV